MIRMAGQCSETIYEYNSCKDETLLKQDGSFTGSVDYTENLLFENQQLRIENQHILEGFLQKIHDLENERNLLKLRLTAVESDYDAQIKELQSDIVSMRMDLKREKKVFRQFEKERSGIIAELTQQNQTLKQNLKSSNESEARLREEIDHLRSDFAKRKSAIQDHFQSLDALRQEISQLRDEKSQLESKLASVIEERDNLLDTLSDSYKRINAMEVVQNDQLTTIHNQDLEITHLQETANMLQDRIQKLSMHTNTDQNDCGTPNRRPNSSQPHKSLLAELAEQRMEIMQMGNSALLGLDLTDDDDEEVEMDDASLLAYSSLLRSNDPDQNDLTTTGQNSNLFQDSSGQGIVISDLKSELTEIYGQMRQMCADLCALSGAQATAINSCGSNPNGGGTHTPDELAMVEMDFRLNSLRSVLTDLHGLLRDLMIEVPESPKRMIESGEPTKTREHRSENSTESDENSTSRTEDCPITDYQTECEAARSERDALVAQLQSAEQQVQNIRQQIQDGILQPKTENSNFTPNLTFVANWQEFGDEKYEFEMPF